MKISPQSSEQTTQPATNDSVCVKRMLALAKYKLFVVILFKEYLIH